MDPRGRIHQDNNFDVKGLDGEKVQEILGLVEEDNPDDQPIMVYLKVTNNRWQKYFIDARIGFWEEYDFKRDNNDKIEGRYFICRRIRIIQGCCLLVIFPDITVADKMLPYTGDAPVWQGKAILFDRTGCLLPVGDSQHANLPPAEPFSIKQAILF